MQPDLSRLSLQQKDIMRLLAKGLTDAAIATRLSLSVAVVLAHKQQMADKLGLTDMDELTRISAKVYL
ncbi:LuxR C-terminal-related transcriptional regulator [Spirosoma sp.]|uniref:LuxR C-terminal-related transcriptional regulator n=1 Tax=Spirosoma sp. TaxID=1899569 RepID=UPI0026383C2C|nr:LuxR C-terminal-related transcriptional regulator [Spirosoma sp.]MCX6217840.1 LuxR C-terminal-related transcriptional regulator [Spirosoma sp.]